MRLGDICSISSGYTARGKLQLVAEGGVPAVQLRDVDGDGLPLESAPLRYDIADVADRYLVRGGEVLFRSRGETNTASAVSQLAEAAVVILPLVIIRPNRNRIIPEYLAWAINQPDAQRQIAAEAQGTNIQMIPMSVVDRLDIAVPDIRMQCQIAELSALAKQEGRLLHQLASRRGQLISAILGKAASAADKTETV